MKTSRSILATRIAAAAAILCVAPSLHAAERYWIGPKANTAPFNSSDNWSTNYGGAGGAGVPGAGDNAKFTLAGTYTVDFSALSPTNTNLEIQLGTVSFDLVGQTYTLSGVVEVGFSGSPSGTIARLTLYNGTLDVDTNGDNIEIGTLDKDGFLTVSTNATIGAGGTNPDILIGNSADGTLTINNGGVVNSATGQFGLASLLSTGTATVTGPGSQWINAGAFVIGSSGTGTLTVSSGATTSGSGSQIGSGGSSTGTATVTGAGSSWTEAGSFTVGNFGAGTLTISAGATMSVASSAFIAGQGGSFGTVSVSGTGSRWTIGADLTVGGFGQGSLTISAAGQVTCAALVLGNLNSAGTEGTVTISGTGSSLTASGAADIGDADIGTLTVSSGGLLVTKAGANIGNASTGVGNVTVTGTNALWMNTGTINVAALGFGTLTVSAGGTVMTDSLSINNPAGAPLGTLNFDGGSILISGSFTNGGVFNHTEGSLQVVGNFQANAAPGAFTINGATNADLPTLDLIGTGTTTNITSLTVGGTHRGQLQLRDARSLNLGANAISLGAAAGGEGTVNVESGAILITTGTLAVGGSGINAGGAGTLLIDGGTVQVGPLRLQSGGVVNLERGVLAVDSVPALNGVFNWTSG